jgi:hypothetical protein
VRAGRPATVEYTVLLPLRYADGRYRLRLPPAEAEGGPRISARTDHGTSGFLTRLRVAAAPRLSTKPRGAYVVVVLDASRSLSAELGREQVAAARRSRLPACA